MTETVQLPGFHVSKPKDYSDPRYLKIPGAWKRYFEAAPRIVIENIWKSDPKNKDKKMPLSFRRKLKDISPATLKDYIDKGIVGICENWIRGIYYHVSAWQAPENKTFYFEGALNDTSIWCVHHYGYTTGPPPPPGWKPNVIRSTGWEGARHPAGWHLEPNEGAIDHKGEFGKNLDIINKFRYKGNLPASYALGDPDQVETGKNTEITETGETTPPDVRRPGLRGHAAEQPVQPHAAHRGAGLLGRQAAAVPRLHVLQSHQTEHPQRTRFGHGETTETGETTENTETFASTITPPPPPQTFEVNPQTTSTSALQWRQSRQMADRSSRYSARTGVRGGGSKRNKRKKTKKTYKKSKNRRKKTYKKSKNRRKKTYKKSRN